MTFNGELRKYQEAASRFLTDRGSGLLALDLGTGKTVVSIHAIEKLREEGKVKCALLIMSSSLTKQWEQRIKQFTDCSGVIVLDGSITPKKRSVILENAMETTPQYLIMGIRQAVTNLDFVKRLNPELILVDECFLTGTLVDTPNGRVPIENIKVGDTILNAMGQDVVEAIGTKHKSRLVRVLLEDGREFMCSENHPFFTDDPQQCILEASKLLEGMYLYGQQEAVRVLQYGITRENSSNCFKEASCTTQQEQILWDILLSEMADETAGCAQQSIYLRETEQDKSISEVMGGTESRKVREEKEKSFGTTYVPNGREQQETKPDLEGTRTQATDSWWERNRTYSTSEESVGNFGNRMDLRTSSQCMERKKASRKAFSLQNRSGTQRYEDSCGDRRKLSQHVVQKDIRSEEGSISIGGRVASIEVYEQGSSEFRGYSGGKDTVALYDLKIRNHPSFSVNGILVHNCTSIKNFGSQQSKAVKKMQSTYRIGLTAEPIENGKAEELFSIMQWIDPTVLGDWRKFDSEFITRNPYTNFPTGYKNMDKLNTLLMTACVNKRRDDPDVAKFMPTVEEFNVYIEMDEEVALLYRRITEELLHALYEVGPTGASDLARYYEGGGSGDDNSNLGPVTSRLLASQLLLDSPAILRSSGMSYSDDSNKQGSKYASQLLDAGRIPDTIGAKMEACTELVEEYLEENPEHKVIVFARFKGVLPMLAKQLDKYGSVVFTGDLNSKQRGEAIEHFTNEPDIRLFLSSDAGGYGVDLWVASHLVNYDLPNAAGTFKQRNGRHVRASSKFRKVYVDNLIVRGTIEEYQLSRLDYKNRVAKAALTGQMSAQDGTVSNEGKSLTKFLENYLEKV